MRKQILFNNEWEFQRKAIGSDVTEVLEETDGWQCIDIPHDWMIYDTKLFYESCDGWYRKSFTIKDLQACRTDIEYHNLRYLLRFEGVYMDSTIYLNGINIGEWKYGYSTFELDITDNLKKGENEIILRAVMQMPNSRWYTGGGIYRNIWLITVPETHFSSDGIYISTNKLEDQWEVHVSSDVCDGKEIIDYSNDFDCLHIRHTILDSKGDTIAIKEDNQDEQMLLVDSPKLWDIENPNLYVLKSELLIQGVVIDEVRNRFGFRSIHMDPDKGFLLNGRSIKLHGVCQHHDLGALGAAVNAVAIKRQLVILKEMGVNAIRTAHNMCAVELLDLADEMGILINNEAFDMWERPKNTYDYARFFKEWVSKDVASWVQRDRNHPSVIMWSIGNEIYDTHADERGQELTKELMNLVYQYDWNHNAYATLGSNYIPWENTQKCADIIKLIGYNYSEKYYDTHHEKYKDWVIYGSETGSIVQSRGVYHFPLASNILSDDDEQCSSLGNSITSWGARSIEKCIVDDRDAKYSCGMFIWSGFDYIGEPTPYHTKNSYFGQIDTAGFKKDSYYLYQAEWTNYKISPMVHLYPYWDFNEGQLIDVCICSNAPKVELFFNECSQGTFEFDHLSGKELVAKWQIPFEKGTLRALAYDEFHNVIAEELTHSFQDSKKIILSPDKTTLMADGRDLIFVEISMEDEEGHPVHNANNRVNVHVTGAGRLIGLDNGDSTDYESYKETSKRLFSGRLLAIIAAKTTPGEICVEVSSESLESAKITLNAIESLIFEGVSAKEENKETFMLMDKEGRKEKVNEIPIRKLEIISPQGRYMSQELLELDVTVQVYPKNATYKDIEWRVTNASGVDSNIASIIPKGESARIRAWGDGTFYVRATAKNGGIKVKLLSVLEFYVTGVGAAYYNPYELISGSLYSQSFGNVGNGNERGVATPRGEKSYILYDKLDFGDYGSHMITLPIFELGSQPTRIEIWEGVPNSKDGELLADVIYHKSSIWNTYQEETYCLKKRLVGITSISFVLRDKVHIKGFYFEPLEKAYEQLSVISCNNIYGDSYHIGKDAITGIGNNVTITFQDMDFNKGLHKVILCGRSLVDKNTIHIRFNSEDDEIKQIIEFTYSEEYVERVYELQNVTGLQSVSFLFLPGCDFDFKWFRFEG